MRLGRLVGKLLAVLSVSCLPSSQVEGRPVTVISTADRPQQLLPIIFVPGKGGSQIEARVNRTGRQDQGHTECHKQLDWYRMWMDLWTFLKHGVDCWSENTRLQFDPLTKQHSNAPGVDTRVPGWGGTDSIEYVDPSWIAWALGNVGAYAKRFVDALVLHGYERGVSVRGAPYDFRYAPHSQPFYFVRLRQLVQDTWAINGRRRVVLFAHSMGGIYAAYFLSRQSAVWKERYIEALVTVNTPWAGTVVAVQMQAAGYNWEIDAFDRLVIRHQQRSFESTFLLLPTAAAWSSSNALLSTPHRNYTVNDYPQLFTAVGYPQGRLKLEAIREADYDFLDQDLGVSIYCLYSGGVSTPERLVYESASAFPDSEPRIEMGDGDGTVNARSLEACVRWRSVQSQQPVTVKYYEGVAHNEILHHRTVINDLLHVAQRTTDA